MPGTVCKVIFCLNPLAGIVDRMPAILADPDLSKEQKDKLIGYCETAKVEVDRAEFVHSVTVQELPEDQQAGFIEDIELKAKRLASHLSAKILDVIG